MVKKEGPEFVLAGHNFSEPEKVSYELLGQLRLFYEKWEHAELPGRFYNWMCNRGEDYQLSRLCILDLTETPPEKELQVISKNQ